jgi:protein involved in polysaccharide export with SLBB domain
MVPLLEGAIDPDEYVLGPYDELMINIMGPESRSFTTVVLPEGDVFLPQVGAVRADGLTLNEFRKRLEQRVDKYFRNIELYCYLKTPRVFRVFVTGEVTEPGAAEVTGAERVSDAIDRKGGVNKRGSKRLIRLERGGEQIRVDLLRFLLLGDNESNPFLSSGDRIHVPLAARHATISGEIGRPGYYEIAPEETVEGLIELAGGFTPKALVDSVLISRIGDDGIVSTWSIGVDEFAMVLEDLDEVSIYEKKRSTRAVFVIGAVGRSGRYEIAPGECLSELAVRLGRFDEFANLEETTIRRRNGELIKLNLEEYLPPGPVKEFELQDADVIDVPQLFQNVTVGGLVNEPGAFPYRNEYTVAQYIGLAGGPTTEGSIDRIEIVSPDGRRRGASGSTRPELGDVIIVKRASSRIFSEVFTGLVGLGALVISIVALTQ